MASRARVLAAGLALASLLAGVPPTPLAAQLISPGKLASVHSELEGMRNCTACHQLRKSGIAPELCLECHEPLAHRLSQGQGFHASLDEEDCAACHKEHLGVDFALVRLDTLAFQHEATGYPLNGGHATASCRACHAAGQISDPTVRSYMEEHGALERTFLGLPTVCADCHATDDPHREQFSPRSCDDCHDPVGWEDAIRFDHNQARYALTGAHRTTACAECHVANTVIDGTPFVRYAPLASGSCSDCHRDPHDASMPGTCRSCHATSAWQDVDRRRVEERFDHEATGFSLVGRHEAAPCGSCHDRGAHRGDPDLHIRFEAGTASRAFPRPLSDSCLACHRDLHDASFVDSPRGADCGTCHGQDGWLPASYGVDRHNTEAAYPLEGAHQVVACQDCHVAPAGGLPDFRLGEPTCFACHGETQPHGRQFDGQGCESCHVMDAFRIPVFDHSQTRYPLDGAHDTAPCAACHRGEEGPDGETMIRYRPLGMECRDCHGGEG